MNSPFLHEQARRLAAGVRDDDAASSPSATVDTHIDPAQGVRRLYLRALGREPQAGELALGVEFIERQGAANTLKPGQWKGPIAAQGEQPLSAWDELAQVLLLTNEFMFVD